MDAAKPDTPLFRARLTPHRSLTRVQFHRLLIVVGIASLCVTAPFVALGAWPVAGFMGLDVLIVWLAFRANFRAARASETLSLTPLELHVAKVSAKGARRDWRFNPAWVKLERDEHEDFGTQRLALVSRGRQVEIAAFLGPDQKAELAGKLARALGVARAGARFD